MNYKVDNNNSRINPYNFVRLGNGVVRSAVKYGDNTGVIRCRLKTETPLAMPDESYSRKTDHKETDFFRVGGKPVIPGSELRGMVRSVYETLSDSCFSVINDPVLTARSSYVRKPGVLRWENGQWNLYKATIEKNVGNVPGIVVREWYNTRKNKKIIHYFKEGKKYPVDDLDLSVKDYYDVLDIYRKNEKKKLLKEYIEKNKPEKDGKKYPVFYLEYQMDGMDGKKYVYLSPAQISRSVFRKKVPDLLGTYSFCNDTKNVCEACSLFGMIDGRGSKSSAIASRVRFTDAAAVGEIMMLPDQRLQILSSPKLSSVEFYSHLDEKNRMNTLWTYDEKGLSLNGRKFYFHHNGDYSSKNKRNMNMTTELADKGSVFEFDVFFDRLTDNELARLVWTLALGENDDRSRHMYKLGHGKPLGLGSVKITVSSVVRRFFDTETFEYREETVDTGEFFKSIPFDSNAGYFSDLMKITDFDYLNGNIVGYPYGEDGNGNKKTSCGTLTWFKANRNDGKMVKPNENCHVRYYLPRISDEKLTPEKLMLPALISSGGSKK